MSSWPLLQEADVDLYREKVSILAVTPCVIGQRWMLMIRVKKPTVYEALWQSWT